MGKIGKTEADTVRYRLYFGSTGTITYHLTLKKNTHKRFLWIMKSEHNDAREKNLCCFEKMSDKSLDEKISTYNLVVLRYFLTLIVITPIPTHS